MEPKFQRTLKIPAGMRVRGLSTVLPGGMVMAIEEKEEASEKTAELRAAAVVMRVCFEGLGSADMLLP